MTAQQIVDGIGARLHADGQHVATRTLPGGPTLVGYRGDFRLRWMATKLHLFTVAVAVPTINGNSLSRFVDDALEFAINERGGARGLQVGVAAIPIMVGNGVDPEAVHYARTRIVKKWAAFAWPTVIDATSGVSFRHEGSVVVGGIYAGWMRNQTRVAIGW